MMDMAMAMDMQLLLNMDTKKIIILVIMDTSMKSSRNTIMGSLLFQGIGNTTENVHGIRILNFQYI